MALISHGNYYLGQGGFCLGDGYGNGWHYKGEGDEVFEFSGDGIIEFYEGNGMNGDGYGGSPQGWGWNE